MDHSVHRLELNYRLSQRWHASPTVITPFTVIQSHRFWYQSKPVC